MRHHCSVLCLGALLASAACERTHELLPPPADAGDEADAPSADAAGDDSGSDAQADAGEPVLLDGGVYMCGKEVCACSNGIDDDVDMLADGFDPECTGPYDDDEATFATGEIKEGNRRCDDCFFDGNPGSGDDDCRVPTSCKTLGDNSSASGNCDDCTPSATCVKNCLPRTPNGCDCFGCCLIETGTQTLQIQLADTCSMAVITNEALCPSCYPSQSDCFNPCGRCELCPGRTSAELPGDCSEFELGYDCEDAEVCDGTNALCPADVAWCLQGCCAPLLY